MSSVQRRGLVGIVLPVAAISAGIFLNDSIADFNRTFGSDIRALEGYELASDYATRNADVKMKQAASNLSWTSEDERKQKLMNVSLTTSESLRPDGQNYERLNNDSFLNDIVYPVDNVINARLPQSVGRALGYSDDGSVKLPLGYALGYSTIGLGLVGLGQTALALRRRR